MLGGHDALVLKFGLTRFRPEGTYPASAPNLLQDNDHGCGRDEKIVSLWVMVESN